MRLHCTVRSTLGASWNVELGPAWRTSNFISTPHYKKVKNNKVCTYTNERVHDGGELHLTGETGYRDGEVLLWRVVRCGRRREHGVVGACVEDGAEFILWIRAGGSTLKHPDRQSNADFGVNEVLSGIRSTLAPMRVRHVWQNSYRLVDLHCDIATSFDDRAGGRIRNQDTLRECGGGERGESYERCELHY